MKAKNKQEFIESWEEYAQEFKGLGHSAETLETWQTIKEQVEAMKAIIQKVAEECYE